MTHSIPNPLKGFLLNWQSKFFKCTWSILISNVSSVSAPSKQWLAKMRALTDWECRLHVVPLFFRSQFRLGLKNLCERISQVEVATGPNMGKLACDDSMIWELANELFSCCWSWLRSCWKCWGWGTLVEQADCDVGLTRDTAEHCKNIFFCYFLKASPQPTD